MTQYLMSVYMVDGIEAPTEEEMQKSYRDVDVFNSKLQDAGAWVFAGGLHPANTSTVVRVVDGDLLRAGSLLIQPQLAAWWIKVDHPHRLLEGVSARKEAARSGHDAHRFQPIHQTDRPGQGSHCSFHSDRLEAAGYRSGEPPRAAPDEQNEQGQEVGRHFQQER